MRLKQSVVRRTIPLAGIVLVLGISSCGRVSFYSYTVPRAVQAENEKAPAKQELITLIATFLRDVPKNERSTFDRFFADDIIYTRGTGQVVAKKDILADTGNADYRE